MKYEDFPKQTKSIVYAVDEDGDKIQIDENGEPVLDEYGNFIKLKKPLVN